MDKTCRFCLEAENPNDALFRPCVCNEYVHKGCLRTWRETTRNPINYTCCSVCKKKFSTKETKKPDERVLQDIQKQKNYRIAIFLSIFVLSIFAFIVVWSIFGWVCDRQHKNIPVMMKWVTTSLISGHPIKNMSKTWQEEFQNPDIKTWPYYGLFGLFISSICVLLFHLFNLCCGGGSRVENYSTTNSYSRGAYYGNNCNCGGCYCICIDCPNGGNGNCCDCGNCKCDDCCKGGGNNCGPEACIVILVVVVIIAIIIIFSAIIVLIGYAIKKLADYARIYDDMAQQYVLEQNGVIEICDRDDPGINRNTNVNPVRQNYRAMDQMV